MTAVLVARRREPHDGVDVEAIGPIGRDAAGRGVGMEEIAVFLQRAHRFPDGGRRDPEAEAASNSLASGGLGGLDISVHYRLEDAELPFGQLIGAGHIRKSMSPRVR